MASASSGLATVITSSTPAVCTVSGNTATLIAAGTCSLMTTQPGNAVFKPAQPVTRSFQVQFAENTDQMSIFLPFVNR